MKVGDLIFCTWQPSVSRVVNDHCLPMEHTIKGEVGIIVQLTRSGNQYFVMFPQLGGYIHQLGPKAFRVLK